MTRVRSAARIVLLDQSLRIFLFKARFASMRDATEEPGDYFWMTPGGGLKPGESFEQAAYRELSEETGIRDAEFVKVIWHRQHKLEDRRSPRNVVEHYFLARVKAPVISTRGQTAVERRVLRAHKWWTVDEIKRSSERFAPRDLGELLDPICRGDIPHAPHVIGR